MRGRSVSRVILVAAATIVAGVAGLFSPAAHAEVNVYTTPGIHTVNGRQWRTWCERYSVTARCHTDLWATTVLQAPDGSYYRAHTWTFNNLTYLSSPESLWRGNPLATPGEHVINGRRWKTECHTPATGNGCRSYLWTTQVLATSTSTGWKYTTREAWVFNNMVQFGALRTDLASLVKWRPPVTPPPAPPAPPTTTPTIPSGSYSMFKGPNTTNKVTLTFDDCPKSLSSFKATLLAAEQAGIGLVLFPTGDCLSSGRFDAAFARAHGHYVFNHSISHPDLRTLSYAGVVRQLGAPGAVTTYGRPPYGAYNSTVQRAYAAVGMRIWLWDVDTNDWRGKSQSQLVSYVVSTARPGNSVLMHMQWNAFNASAIKAMQAGLARKGIGVCRNFPGTTPVKPSALSC